MVRHVQARVIQHVLAHLHLLDVQVVQQAVLLDVQVLAEADVLEVAVILAQVDVAVHLKATLVMDARVIVIVLAGVPARLIALTIVQVIAMHNVRVIAHNNVREGVMEVALECVTPDVQAVVKVDANIHANQDCIIKT